jgi:DNA-binding GntR family transcriptional regulator
MASLVEPEKPKLADWAYGELRRYIIEGVLPPGTRLVESKITESLRISRTPLREALRRLEQEGLLERHLGGGLRVTDVSMDEIHEIMDMRALLEGHCAALAAAGISADEMAQLVQAHHEAVRAIHSHDLAALTEANTQFHEGIVGAARAPRFTAIIDGIRESVLRFRSEALSDELTRQHSFEQHTEILRLLQAGDATGVEALMREHIRDIEKHLTSTRRGTS